MEGDPLNSAELARRARRAEGALVDARARASALETRLGQVMANAAQSEELAERVRAQTHELGQEVARRGAAEAALSAERNDSAALQRELAALAAASRGHLKEFSALSETLDAVSRVRCFSCCYSARWYCLPCAAQDLKSVGCEVAA
jgi:hypothetical protein